MKKIISMFLSLVMAITMFTGCNGQEGAYRLIKVNSFEGMVTIQRGEKMDAFEGLQLVSEDLVEVGVDSLLELLADSDKHIVAEENTAFKLHSAGNETSGNITIDLMYGSSLITIDNKLPNGSLFQVNTPNASLSVRGTIFRVAYDPETNTTEVEVEEGVVAVTYADGMTTLEQGDAIAIANEAVSETNTPTAAEEPLFDISREYQLTGDDSYKDLKATCTISAASRSDYGAAFGIPAESYYYNEDFADDNPYLSGILSELKLDIDAHADEINEFFEANQSRVIEKRKAEGNKYVQEKVDVDWFPDTITTTNDSGTYKLTLTKTTMAIDVTTSMGSYSTENFISDYYIETNKVTGEESAIHTYSVRMVFYGNIEKIS